MNKTKILKALKIYAISLIIAYSVLYILGIYWYWAMSIPSEVPFKELGFIAFCTGSFVGLSKIAQYLTENKL